MMEILRPIAPLSILKPEGNQKSTDSASGLSGMSFEKTLAKALEGVNDLQMQSADLDAKLSTGKLEYVHQAMVMSEKATLALQLTLQVRNKVVEAYQEIMRSQM
jgi:flagellar hook-basal body complex protein FliE